MLKNRQRKIYIASSWKNAEKVRYLAKMLRADGHLVFDFTDMDNRPEGLDKFVFGAKQWAEHSGKSPNEIEYKDFLTWPPTQRAFKSDRAGLDWADTVVLVLPSGRSSHLEAGYGVGAGKELFIFGDLPVGEFDAMYGFAKACYHKNEEFHMLEALTLNAETNKEVKK
jgi:hypothetical protein